MMFQRVGIPLIIVGILVLLVLAIVIFLVWHRKVTMKDALVEEYLDSDRPCGNVNPRTGWICERWEGHPKKHYQTINGERFDWIDD